MTGRGAAEAAIPPKAGACPKAAVGRPLVISAMGAPEVTGPCIGLGRSACPCRGAMAPLWSP